MEYQGASGVMKNNNFEQAEEYIMVDFVYHLPKTLQIVPEIKHVIMLQKVTRLQHRYFEKDIWNYFYWTQIFKTMAIMLRVHVRLRTNMDLEIALSRNTLPFVIP